MTSNTKYRIAAVPFQVIGFLFVTIFFINALIFPPWHPKSLAKAVIKELTEGRGGSTTKSKEGER